MLTRSLRETSAFDIQLSAVHIHEPLAIGNLNGTRAAQIEPMLEEIFLGLTLGGAIGVGVSTISARKGDG